MGNLMGKCLPKPRLAEAMIPLIHFFRKLELESTSLGACSLIWNQPLLMKSGLGLTDSFSIRNSWLVEKKTRQITTPVDITLLEKKSSIFVWIEFANLQTTALVYRDFSSLMLLVEVLVLVLVRFFSSDCLLTTEKNQNSDSLSTHLHRSPPPSSSHTIPSFPPTLFWSTLMSPLCLITKPSMISAGEVLILNDQHIPT